LLTSLLNRNFALPISLIPQNGETLFTPAVVDAFGHPAPSTAYQRWYQRQFRAGSAGVIVVSPGGTFQDQIVLSKLYDLTAPGTYTAHISAKWPDLPEVQSNAFQFTVIPSDPKLKWSASPPARPGTKPPNSWRQR
ncbi:MAG: hypothetical protein ACRD2D_11730, partial [Terriglobales bacterium]